MGGTNGVEVRFLLFDALRGGTFFGAAMLGKYAKFPKKGKLKTAIASGVNQTVTMAALIPKKDRQDALMERLLGLNTGRIPEKSIWQLYGTSPNSPTASSALP